MYFNRTKHSHPIYMLAFKVQKPVSFVYIPQLLYPTPRNLIARVAKYFAVIEFKPQGKLLTYIFDGALVLCRYILITNEQKCEK